MTKKALKTITFLVKGECKKKCKGRCKCRVECEIREPNFEQISFGLTALTTPSGKLAMTAGGRVIFDVCKVKCDPEIEASGVMMSSLCIRIAEEYLLPVEVEIKKN